MGCILAADFVVGGSWGAGRSLRGGRCGAGVGWRPSLMDAACGLREVSMAPRGTRWGNRVMCMVVGSGPGRGYKTCLVVRAAASCGFGSRAGWGGWDRLAPIRPRRGMRVGFRRGLSDETCCAAVRERGSRCAGREGQLGDWLPATHSDLALRIHATSHLTGQFTLRSGRTATEYFDKYRFEADPALLDEIAGRMAPLMPQGTQVLAGLEMGGIPVVTAIGRHTGLPCAFVRKQAKPYGTCRLIEGAEVADRKVLAGRARKLRKQRARSHGGRPGPVTARTAGGSDRSCPPTGPLCVL